MEVNSIKAFLSMQSPAATPAINPNSLEIVAEDYVAPRFARKIKSKVCGSVCIRRSEPVLLNVYGAPELIPRNEFNQPM